MINITKRGWRPILQYHTGMQSPTHKKKSRFNDHEDLIKLINEAALFAPVAKMALDFAVLSVDGSSADIVSLEIHQHDELMHLAEKLRLPKLLRFCDYFEEIDVPLAELPGLSEELSIIKKTTAKSEIAEFADHLTALIGLAVGRKQLLTAVPD